MIFNFKALVAAVTLALVAGNVAAAPVAAPSSNLMMRAPPSGNRRVAPSVIPSAFQPAGAATDSDKYTFTISLQPANQAGLTARMEQIAATGGEWLTEDELATYVRPTADATNAVTSFLTQQGIPASAQSWSKFGTEVTVTSDIAKTSKLFSAQFQRYNVHGKAVARTKSFTIPDAIASHVQDVYPLASFPLVRHTNTGMKPLPEAFNATFAERATPSSCSTSAVTPNCLRALYGTSSYTPTGGSTQPDLGIMAYIDQYFSQSDLNTFVSNYRTDITSPTIKVILRNGGTNDASNPGTEAMLDVETAVGTVGNKLTTQFIVESDSSYGGDIFLLTFQDLVNNFSSTTRPKVISISYGSDEQYFTSSQAQSMCNAAQQLTALGTTIVVSSGDYGLQGQKDDTCPSFNPTYPGGCPYILSVGALQSFSPEVMVSPSLAGFYSGAGASTFFSIPSFQSSQVAAYKPKISSTSSGQYNANGRFFPDVSAQGSNYIIVQGGQTGLVGGTSASAPEVASILALVNDYRKSSGKSSLGWANPTFYSAGSGSSSFTDVTSGSSACPKSTSYNFPAASGWDSASGLGSPKFAGLITL